MASRLGVSHSPAAGRNRGLATHASESTHADCPLSTPIAGNPWPPSRPRKRRIRLRLLRSLRRSAGAMSTAHSQPAQFRQPSILLHRGRAIVELLQISQGRIGNFPPISWKHFGEYLHHVAEGLSADTKAMELLDFVERRFAQTLLAKPTAASPRVSSGGMPRHRTAATRPAIDARSLCLNQRAPQTAARNAKPVRSDRQAIGALRH